jgi:hypothetical protein
MRSSSSASAKTSRGSLAKNLARTSRKVAMRSTEESSVNRRAAPSTTATSKGRNAIDRGIEGGERFGQGLIHDSHGRRSVFRNLTRRTLACLDPIVKLRSVYELLARGLKLVRLCSSQRPDCHKSGLSRLLSDHVLICEQFIPESHLRVISPSPDRDSVRAFLDVQELAVGRKS